MQRDRTARPFGSFAAGLAMLMPVVALTIHQINAPALISASGDIDDAGQRSAGLILMALPLFYVFAVLLSFGAGQLLLRSGLRRLWHYIGFAALVALLIAAPVARASSQPEKFGWSDTLVAFLAFGAVFLACGGLGAACSWWFAVQPRSSSGERNT
jgi:hypothetical protein